MKILLDEQLPHRLRKHLGNHEVYTVGYMGWAGLKNGELLCIAEAEAFDVFLTGDKNLAYQQNLASRCLAIVALSTIDFDILQTKLSDRRRCRQCRARRVSRGRLRHDETAGLLDDSNRESRRLSYVQSLGRDQGVGNSGAESPPQGSYRGPNGHGWKLAATACERYR